MAREIEILIEVSEPIASALRKLPRLHAHGVKETIDTYYTHEKLKQLRPDKDGQAFLTHKRDRFLPDGTWTHSDEQETPIENTTNIQHILDALGFTELVRIDNRKHTFTTDEYEVVLEDVKDLGGFLEVEAKHPSDNVAAEKAKIRVFIATLGSELGAELNVGKPELMLRKKRTQRLYIN